jgi:hypothetical protein
MALCRLSEDGSATTAIVVMIANILNYQYLCHAVSGLQFLGVFAKLRKAATSFAIRLSIVLSARNNSSHIPRIFMKFDI